LVTGASSGIGRNLAETLTVDGYFVYAGARKQADLDELNEIPNIQAVRLDVTKQDEIDAAVDTARKGGKGLYGLVNNAGIVTLPPITDTMFSLSVTRTYCRLLDQQSSFSQTPCARPRIQDHNRLTLASQQKVPNHQDQLLGPD
jgi:NAD(P)-dependent dehydrogenase (short-subunit alcohol dehydrogenase family)